MIVTLDEYENLPKYATHSSYDLDGFEDLWNNPDQQTLNLRKHFREVDKNSPSPSPEKKVKSDVVVKPKSTEEIWKGFARKVNQSYKKDLLPRRGCRF